LNAVRETVEGATNVRHVAADGETPGWDIEYRDANGELNAMEVKAASGSAFPLLALSRRRLFRVKSQLAAHPRPWGLAGSGNAYAQPVIWRVRRT
jgi:hypothetical protein